MITVKSLIGFAVFIFAGRRDSMDIGRIIIAALTCAAAIYQIVNEDDN